MTEEAKELGRMNAFPLVVENGERGDDVHYGMSLREYYAGLAMQGMLTSGCMKECVTPDTIAKYAVIQADALIAELIKNER